MNINDQVKLTPAALKLLGICAGATRQDFGKVISICVTPLPWRLITVEWQQREPTRDYTYAESFLEVITCE